MDYRIDLKERYSDILLLLNTKNKLDSFFTYMIKYLIENDDKEKIDRGDDYFPLAIENKSTLGLDYNVLVKILSYWTRDVLEFKQWDLIVQVYGFSLRGDIVKPKNASIFLVTNVFGSVHRATSIGFKMNYGIVSYSQLFCVPIIYKSVKNNEKIQYNMVTFFLKKIEKSLENTALKELFNDRFLNENFEQIAFGVKQCDDEWEADDRKFFSI